MKRVLISLMLAGVVWGACTSPKIDEPLEVVPVVAKPGPAYEEVAAKYNANTQYLQQLFCAGDGASGTRTRRGRSTTSRVRGVCR